MRLLLSIIGLLLLSPIALLVALIRCVVESADDFLMHCGKRIIDFGGTDKI